MVRELSNLTGELEGRWPRTPLYPVFGNHDYWPGGDFPSSGGPIYGPMATRWAPHVGNATTMRQSGTASPPFPVVVQMELGRALGGFYSLPLPGTKVRLVGLNTNLYFFYNHLGLAELGGDPGGQLGWLRDQCDGAREAGHTVLLQAHVPPGFPVSSICLRTPNLHPDGTGIR